MPGGRFFPVDYWLHITDIGTTPVSEGFFPFPSLYAAINENNNGINGLSSTGTTITAAFNYYIGFSSSPDSSGKIDSVLIRDSDDLRWSAGNYIANANHCGKALTLDSASSQYAYHADTDELDMGTEDFAVGIWLKSSSNNQIMYEKKEAGSFGVNAGYGLRIDGTGYCQSVIDDGSSNYVNNSGNTLVNDGYWYFAYLIFDRSGNVYHFIDGIYDDSQSISLVSATVNNTIKAVVGARSSGGGASVFFNGDLDIPRVFRFGTNGLSVTGTPNSNLVIKVGDASGTTLYDETVIGTSSPVGLIPDMYRSPYESLTNLGYSELDDAVRTECLSETAFATHANWDVTNDWDDTGGNAEYTYSASNTSTLTQVNADQANNLGDSEWYAFTYTVAVTTAPDGDFALTITNDIASSAVTLDFTAGTHTVVFQSASDASSQDFIINAVGSSDTQGQFSIDDVTLKRIGVVGEWKMNETGTPATLTDNTSNSLDLTTANSPSMSDNYLV